MNASNLNDIFDTVGSLIVSIINHGHSLAKMHPESHSHHVTKKKIAALTAAKDGLQAYLSNMEKFWELDIETAPAQFKDETMRALRTMRNEELEKWSKDPDITPEAQNLAKIILSERFLNKMKAGSDI